jgi:hypothetical protein
MFCQECGKPLNEEDEFCKTCGASIKDQGEKNSVSFDWNLSGFPKPKRTEEIDFNWGISNMKEKQDKESKEHKDPLDRLDKYFSFDKANEDFQKLLDDQYDKKSSFDHIPQELVPLEASTLSNRDYIASEESTSEESTPADIIQNEIEKAMPKEIDDDVLNEEEPEVIWIGDADAEDTADVTDTADTADAVVDAVDLEEKTMEPLWLDSIGETEEEEPKKEGVAVRIILIAITLVLMAEVAILGVQFFLPDSKIASKAVEINRGISDSFVSAKDRIKGLFNRSGDEDEAAKIGGGGLDEGEDADGDLDDEDKGYIDNQPEYVEDPVSYSARFNENIISLRANENLVWEEGRDYAEGGIKVSKPIDENLWYTDEKGDPIYYDKEIAATLVKFDSMWVNYVNNNDKDVIDLTKKGSKARKNVETFSKVGKVKQTFLTLEIGEIRQGKDCFYAWTYEEIKEEQGNDTITKKYSWIYRLEAIGEEMKIVNYYKY